MATAMTLLSRRLGGLSRVAPPLWQPRCRAFCEGNFTDDEQEAVKSIIGRLGAGDMSTALQLAGPHAAKRQIQPELYIAHHASECAAAMYRAGEDSRQQALPSAGNGKALEGQDLATIDLGDPSLWFEQVQQCWMRHHEMALLSGVALQLRGASSAEGCEALKGNQIASKLVARDWQVVGRAIPVRLNTSPWCAVLQSYVSNRVLEEKKFKGFHDGVYNAMMSQVQHWAEHLGKVGPDGPLEDEGPDYEASEFRDWAVASSAGADKHIRLTAHYWAEAARHVDAINGHQLLRVAITMVEEDPSLPKEGAEYAVAVFKDTLNLL